MKAKAKAGRCSEASNDARNLIRPDQMRSDKVAAMQALVEEGLASGTGRRSMETLRRAAWKRSKDRKLS